MKQHVKTLVLGILAGISIGLGGTLFLLCRLNENTILGSFLFSLGLLLICSFGFYLYTGKIGYVGDKNESYIKDLVIMYLGNVIGANVYGYLFRFVSNSKMNLLSKVVSLTKLIDLGNGGKPWYSLFIGGILCGMLVYLAVEGFKKESISPIARISILVACVGTFVFAGFEHCIADMFYFASSNSLFSYDWYRTILTILIITIGNSFGSIIIHSLIKLSK